MNFILLLLSIKAIFCLDIPINSESETLQDAMNEYFQLKDEFPQLFLNLEYLEQKIGMVIGNIYHMQNIGTSNDNLRILDEYFAEYNKMIELSYDNIEKRRVILLEYLEDNITDYVNIYNKWDEDCYNYNDLKSYVDSLLESVNFEGVPFTNNMLT